MSFDLTKEEVEAIRSAQKKIYEQNLKMGWHDNPREAGTMIALCHSELSEALEGIRKSLKDDHLKNRDMAEVELADCVIRILDMAGKYGWDVAGAMGEKITYNRNRADHQKQNREKDGGKKF